MEFDIEPLVNVPVNGEIFVANLLRRQSFFQSFRFGGSAVLVGAANHQRVVIAKLAVPIHTKVVHFTAENTTLFFLSQF